MHGFGPRVGVFWVVRELRSRMVRARNEDASRMTKAVDPGEASCRVQMSARVENGKKYLKKGNKCGKLWTKLLRSD